MTRLEQLTEAMKPFIGEFLCRTGQIQSIVIENLCPAGKAPTAICQGTRCGDCWNKEVPENE